MLFTWNYHETDTRIALHELRSIKPVAITATYTDVLILLTHAYLQYNKPQEYLLIFY